MIDSNDPQERAEQIKAAMMGEYPKPKRRWRKRLLFILIFGAIVHGYPDWQHRNDPAPSPATHQAP